MDSLPFKLTPQYLKRNPINRFNNVALFSLIFAAVILNKKPLGSEIKTFLLHKVWPVFLMVIWLPMVCMIVAKILQYKDNKDWEKLLELTPIFFLGCFALYAIFVVQRTSSNYKSIADIINSKFVTINNITFQDLLVIVTLEVVLPFAFALFLGGCVFYGEVPVPLWVPLTYNDKEYTLKVYLFIWAYEAVAAFYIFLTLAVWGPFVIVSTVCICKELDYLIEAIDQMKFIRGGDEMLMRVYGDQFSDKSFQTGSPELLHTTCSTDQDCKRFLGNFIEHHMIIKRTFKEVSHIHSFLILVQTVVSLIISCFVTFNMYYTNNLTRVVIKNSPILFLSYYLMFAYCWNGQRLTDKFTELYRAVYRCPWYRCPQSFRTSLVIIMEVYKKPVYLTAGGLFPINLERFTTFLQQSITYILILNTLLTEKKEHQF